MDNNINVSYDATQDEEFDSRSVGQPIRDENNKITRYKFKIYVRDKEPIEGTLTREDMEAIYWDYTTEGGNLTQRTVSRNYDFPITEFKKIIKAFNITKASVQFPPHLIEEKSWDELLELTLHKKESAYLKFQEQERGKAFEKKHKELLLEYSRLKDSFKNAEYLGKEKPAKFQITASPKGGKSVMIYLSDMHIGAYVSEEGVYDNHYDEKEVNRRLSLILKKLDNIKNIEDIIIFNLGDAIDGYNAKTTRPSSNHVLPQNMSNKEQGAVLMRQMTGFFSHIKENIPHTNLYFYSVGHSNHGGDFEHSLMTALSISLDSMGVKSHVSTRPIDHFTYRGKNIIFTHGKDNLDQFKGLPLVLNDKTELYLNEYLYRNNLQGETLIVKGDLHQSATSFGKLFKYKSVGSLFGSSNWIHANFGATQWCCDYTIIDDQGDMIDGIIKD